MHQGLIVEQGTYAELMEAKGRYFELETAQSLGHGLDDNGEGSEEENPLERLVSGSSQMTIELKQDGSGAVLDKEAQKEQMAKLGHTLRRVGALWRPSLPWLIGGFVTCAGMSLLFLHTARRSWSCSVCYAVPVAGHCVCDILLSPHRSLTVFVVSAILSKHTTTHSRTILAGL